MANKRGMIVKIPASEFEKVPPLPKGTSTAETMHAMMEMQAWCFEQFAKASYEVGRKLAREREEAILKAVLGDE